MTNVLTRIEMNGLKVNLDTLDEIEKEYNEELSYLENKLQTMAKEAMGDTPINLSSPDDRSVLLYSRKVKDKTLWSTAFNLGHGMRGNTIKPKLRTRMKKNDFIPAQVSFYTVNQHRDHVSIAFQKLSFLFFIFQLLLFLGCFYSKKIF